MSDSRIKLFESAQVRAEWDAENEKWWLSSRYWTSLPF